MNRGPRPPRRSPAPVLGGLAAPIIFVAVVLALTAAESTFLRRSGWSAVHRTKVEWPSLLALGNQGWLLTATLVVCGALESAYGLWLVRVARGRVRIAASLIVVLAVGVALEAFTADGPHARTTSWHGRIHDLAYGLIPLGAIGAAAILAMPSSKPDQQPPLRLASRLAVAAMSVGLGLAAVDSIAQLARYLLFGAILVWLVIVALVTLRRCARS